MQSRAEYRDDGLRQTTEGRTAIVHPRGTAGGDRNNRSRSPSPPTWYSGGGEWTDGQRTERTTGRTDGQRTDDDDGTHDGTDGRTEDVNDDDDVDDGTRRENTSIHAFLKIHFVRKMFTCLDVFENNVETYL